MRYHNSDLDQETLVSLYKMMLKPRMIEEKMLVLLRQGKNIQVVQRYWPRSDFRRG